MKVYLVKRATLKTSTKGISVSEYRGLEGDHFFTSKKKASSYINETLNEDWDYLMFPYEKWINKKPFYEYENIKYYSMIELHEIEVD